jgi:RNA recognition motif-containing protein
VDDICSKDNGFLKARGLPFDCTLQEIKDFFKGFELSGDGIYRSYFRDRPDGQCYAVFKDAKIAGEASKALNNKYLGKRYLEIFDVDYDEFTGFLFKNKFNMINDIKIEFDEE